MDIRTIDGMWDRDNLYNLNYNFNEIAETLRILSDSAVEALGNGTITQKQYEDLMVVMNGLVRKGQLSIYDLDVNKGKIDETFLSDKLLSQIAGTAPINSVVSDVSISTPKLASSAVSQEKTAFLKVGKNLFNKNSVEKGKLLSTSTGLTSSNNLYVTSGYLPVNPSTTYTQSNGDIIVYYDQNKTFVSSLVRSSTPKVARSFTTPTNCYYIRTTTIDTGIDTYSYLGYQIEQGSTATTPQSYYEYIDDLKVKLPSASVTGSNIEDFSVGLDKLEIAGSTTNLFNRSTAVKGYYVNNTHGQLSVNVAYYSSDFINVEGVSKLTKTSTSNMYAFYDQEKNYIPSTTVSTQTINVPESAVYIRFSLSVNDLDKTMLVKGTSLPSEFVPYRIYIPKEYLEFEEPTLTEDSYGKQFLKTYTADFSKAMSKSYNGRAEIAFIGDSWVAGGAVKQGERLTLPLRERLLSIYNDGGIGFISFANNHIGNGDVSVKLKGDWTHYDEGLGNIDKAKGLDSAMVESSTAGNSIEVQFNEEADFFEIHTLNTGTWRYKVEDGEWTYVDASKQEVTPINFALGRKKVTIEIVSGKVSFIGSYAYKGNKGAVVHKIGNGGLKGSHIASTDRANWIKQLKRCRANTFGILIGTNEMAQNVSVEDYESSLREIVSRIKEAKPNASVILIAPSGNKYDGLQTHTIDEYSDAQLELAKELNIGHVSLYRNLGDFAITNENGLMYTDGVHPNADGGYAISNVVYDRLLRL